MTSIDQSEAARFVRRENVKRFRWMLQEVEDQRKKLQQLLAEELHKQVEAGDPLDPMIHKTKDLLNELPSLPVRP